MKVLVIAPHPDDDVLGCGSTIAKHSKDGDEVHICYITEAYTPDWSLEFITERPRQIERANHILGVAYWHFCHFPSVLLDTIPKKDIYTKMRVLINKVEPEIVYIPHKGDVNQDHQIVYQCALSATRPEPNSSIKRVLSYEVLSETNWGDGFYPNVYVDITDTLELKLLAMQEYKEEMKQAPHARSLESIRALATSRGMSVGVQYAEAFMLIRELIRETNGK